MSAKYVYREVDDLIALYLFRCSRSSLGRELQRVGVLMGMGSASLRMRVKNMEYIEWRRGKWEPQKDRKPGPGLKNYATQSCKVYNEVSGLSCGALKAKIEEQKPGLGL